MTDTGATWQVILSRNPKKVIRRVPADLRRRILAKLHTLEKNPRPTGCKKLVGLASLYRVRVGNWRIIYTIKDEELIVLVLEIVPRGSAYRNL